ncbi:hypothetical protein LSH36_974g01032 [Paralvinella palmiformis]|uniref:Uncharacterized protein n=1 Tax=Paralvinella palmiformis TaxID=53620 RepID=A0AAD9MR12_9ANNE|nr:hypothetical protein LSH36_974g01032 [Paralvinella palmiformis]
MKRANSQQSKFIPDDLEEDDDFAHPSSSRQAKKKKRKTKSKSASNQTKNTSASKRSIKERVRPEDTLYEVELQRALELSVEEAGTTQNTSLIQEQSISNDLDGDLTSANHDIPPCLNRVTPLTISKDTECEEAPHLMSEPPCQMSKVIEGQISLQTAVDVGKDVDVCQDVDVCKDVDVKETLKKDRGVKRRKYMEIDSSGSDEELVHMSGNDMTDSSDDSNFSCRKVPKRSKKTINQRKRIRYISKPDSSKKSRDNDQSDVIIPDSKPLAEKTNTQNKGNFML